MESSLCLTNRIGAEKARCYNIHKPDVNDSTTECQMIGLNKAPILARDDSKGQVNGGMVFFSAQ